MNRSIGHVSSQISTSIQDKECRNFQRIKGGGGAVHAKELELYSNSQAIHQMLKDSEKMPSES